MKNNSHGFVNQFMVGLLVTLCSGGTLGVGTVWMRHEISLVANANRALATRITEVDRRIAETKTLVESAQSPEALRRLNAEFQIGLVPVSDGQVVHVTEDPVRRLATRANRGLYGEAPAAVAFTITQPR